MRRPLHPSPHLACGLAGPARLHGERPQYRPDRTSRPWWSSGAALSVIASGAAVLLTRHRPAASSSAIHDTWPSTRRRAPWPVVPSRRCGISLVEGANRPSPTSWPRRPVIAASAMRSARPGRLHRDASPPRKGGHHGQAHRDRVRDSGRGGTGAWRARRGSRQRLHARRVAGATAGPGVRPCHVRASEEHGRPTPWPKDLRHLRQLLAERSGGDPVHRPAQRRPQVRRQPHAGRPPRLGGVDARRRRPRRGHHRRSRSATTKSTSSAVSTSCSRCCASASSTG